MWVRVIAGAYKGRRLRVPRGVLVRPTSDRLKETLFNVLGQRLEKIRVLDACAGTGSLGIEALSRGADEVVFVESNEEAFSLLKDNIARCEIDKPVVLVKGRLPEVATRRELEGCFDLILFDPPYEDLKIGDILSTLASLIKPGGLLVLERAKRREVDVPDSLELARRIVSGDSVLELFRCSKE